MSFVASDVQGWFKDYGWESGVSSEGQVLARFLGTASQTEFRLLTRVSEHWLAMTVFPFLPPPPPPRRARMREALGRLNFDVKVVRFAVSQDEAITLNLDVPAAWLSREVFFDALDLLVYYADESFQPLLRVMTDGAPDGEASP